MKRLMMLVSLTSFYVNAQTNDLSWTFQWDGQSQGVIFLQTNLTSVVKRSICDDIEHVMSQVTVSNIEFTVLATNHPHHSEADGIAAIPDKGHICPSNFPIDYYRLINGTHFFILNNEGCSNYLDAITLTNQYASQIAALPSVLYRFTNGFDVSSMTFEQKKMFIWNPSLDMSLQDDAQKYETELSTALPKGTNWVTFVRPSILAYGLEKLDNDNGVFLRCEILTRVNRATTPISTVLLFVYKDGTWRWCPNIF